MEKIRGDGFAQARDWTGQIFRPSVLGLGLVFLVTAYVGTNIIGFGQLERRLSGEKAASAANPNQHSVAEALASWKNTDGVAARARSLTLDVILIDTPGNKGAIDNALGEVAAGSPTSVAAWQALATFRKISGAPMESVLAAFRMSAITGSHEGYYMKLRAMFGLEYWSELPEHERQIAIRDIVKTLNDTFVGPDLYRGILQKKTQTQREEIKAALMASGLPGQRVLQALAL
jgi:hypothetical protein